MVIRVENIGKRYRVGFYESRGLLSERLTHALRNPLSVLRRKPKDHFWALKDVSFEVKEGEVLGLIGRNGAGKSTLLKILSRITRPTVGHARIHGRVGSLLEVGTGFHPELTGRENVFLNGAILGMGRREIRRKFDEIVAFAEIERFIDTPVKRYSSGMYVRLAFAVAAHLDPDILLVDEVLAVGDLGFQKKCLGKMSDVASHGRTIIFIAHQMNQIRRLCDRVMWLESGAIRACGATGEVVSGYELAFASHQGNGEGPGRCFLRWEIAGSGNALHDGMSETTLCIDVHLKEPVSRGHLGVNILSDTEVLVGGWGFDGVEIPEGFHTVKLAFPFLPLKPGIYSVQCTLINRGNNLNAGELIESSIARQRLAVDAPPRSHPQDRWSGLFNIPADLSVLPSSSNGSGPGVSLGLGLTEPKVGTANSEL